MRFNLPESTGVADVATAAPSRRTLLRTAGTVAWAVPAVTLVSTAPAFAASGVTVPVLIGLSEASTGGPIPDRTLRVSIPLSYPPGAFPIGSVITIRVFDPSSILLGAPTRGPVPSGWQQVGSASGSRNAGWLYTFRTTTASPTVPFTTTFEKTSLNPFRSMNGTVVITVTPTGGTSRSHVLTWQ